MVVDKADLVVDTCLLAGRIMIESGSEMARAEDTIMRIATNSGFPNAQVFSTVTGIIMSIPDKKNAQVTSVSRRNIDLEKVSWVDRLSRNYADHKITLEEFFGQLQTLDNAVPYFPFWLQVIGAALVSGPLMAIFCNNFYDIGLTSVIGAIGFAIYYIINKYLNIKFISEFFASLLIGILAVLTVRLGMGHSVDDIIIGSVMPLVPGVPLTNAVRDILNGHFVSGPARGIEALLTAAAIGFGIAFVFRFF
nr:threonine/serine exporter family protein [Pediococcus damnosus]